MPTTKATRNGKGRLEVAAAERAGLVYVSDSRPGYQRIGSRRKFVFQAAGGRRLRDPNVLKRIRALSIPPAWTRVWICPDAKGHLQATGRDARGRKQYRYHRLWRKVRDEDKFERMIAFGRALPRIRRRVQRDLRQPGLNRGKVLATVVRLLDLCSVRIGNDEYAEQNRSYGLTTLRDRHAQVVGASIHLRFRGKSAKQHELSVTDPLLARVVRQCQDLPGQELFQWLDEEGKVHDVTSGDVNQYLLDLAGRDFTSKDFRTWSGTVLAAMALKECEHSGGSAAVAKANILGAIERVANHLGNTVAVCRKSYVHPAILEGCADGTLFRAFGARAGGARRGLRSEEAAVLRLLVGKRARMSEAHLHGQLRRSLGLIRSAQRRRVKKRTRRSLSGPRPVEAQG